MNNRIRSKLFLLNRGLILIFVCFLTGCYMPVITYDLSMLSDNLIDDSIKKSKRGNTGTKTTEDFNREFRSYFLEKFPLMSSAHEAIAYLTKIGAKCDQNKSVTGVSYQCSYQTKWLLVREKLFSRDIVGEVLGIYFYRIIEAKSGNIAEVIVDVKPEI